MSFMIGSIRATLGLDESNFVRGLLSAQTAAGVFGQTVVNFVNNPLLGTLSIMRNVVLETGRLIVDTTRLNEEYFRTAQRLGVSTRTVSGLQMAYRGVGLQASEIEKQFAKLSTQVDAAAHGNETAADMFERLGVSVRNANGDIRPLDRIIRDVSDGLSQLKNEQERITLGTALFGESYVKVSKIIGDGAVVLEALIERAERYGQVLRDDVAQGAAQASEAMRGMNEAWEGTKRTFATSFTNALVEEMGGVQRASDAMADAGVKSADVFGEAMGRMVANVLPGLTAMLELLVKVQDISERVSGFLLENPALGWTETPALMLARNAFVDDARESDAVVLERVRARRRSLSHLYAQGEAEYAEIAAQRAGVQATVNAMLRQWRAME